MAKNLLRAPLIKSAVLLVVFSLIIYLAATSGEGSVWSSLGTIFYGLFRVAQLGVGLILALLLCLSILIGIFLGCVAMVSPEGATKMYNQLLDFLSDKLGFVSSWWSKHCDTAGKQSVEELKNSLLAETNGQVTSSIADLQGSIDDRFVTLQAEVERLAADKQSALLADRLQHLEEKLVAVDESIAKESERTGQLADRIDELSGKIETISSATDQEDVSQRVASLESTRDSIESGYKSLQENLAALQAEVDGVKTGIESSAGAASPSEDDEEHRLFSYIKQEKDREKVTALVVEGLKKEMTQAQIIEELTGKTGKATAKVITEHPSLTKDFIRSMKKTG